ncbi:MAG: amidohydrolase family protein [Candidatus Methylacidiphilales bacterium]|nr:amidohydrolase family protein [Candidatus Methylacidiphilales bacterium]
MSIALEAPTVKVHPKLGYSIFDIEIHCQFNGRMELARYMEPRYREQYLSGFQGDPKPNLDQRGGNNRADADVSDGCPAGSNPRLIRGQLLDEYGIEWAICTGTIYQLTTMADTGFATALASAHNEWLNHEFVPSDPAFLGVICVALQDPDHAVREIEKWAGHPRVAQVFVSTGGRMLLGHPSYHRVYEAAAAYGLPVAAHTTAEGRGITGPPSSTGYPSTYLEFHSGLAASAVTNCASLVCEGVFAKIPNFKFVLLEGGISWALPLMWALDAKWKRLRALMPQLRELPSHYLRRQMFYTTQPIEEPDSTRDLLATYEQIGESQIMFSSDYPHWDFDNPLSILPGNTAAALKRRILRDNALALYGRRLPAAAVSDSDSSLELAASTSASL